MSDEAGKWHEATKAEQFEARRRLKNARLAAGKLPEELAVFAYQSIPSYYDLENCDGELFCAIGLGELSALCSALGIKPRDLFADRSCVGRQISAEQLMARVQSHLEETAISILEFEERVGFEIGPALNNVRAVMDWNVDFLRWICRELKLDWRLVLP